MKISTFVRTSGSVLSQTVKSAQVFQAAPDGSSVTLYSSEGLYDDCYTVCITREEFETLKAYFDMPPRCKVVDGVWKPITGA